LNDLLSPDIFKWVVMPIVIFIARILDVSLGTTRIIMVSKGKKAIAAFIGFFEVTIWLLVASKVIQSVDNIVYVIAYAGGFAAGSYIGIVLEDKLAIGKIAVRIITVKDPVEFIKSLRSMGYGVTSIQASGSTGQAHIIYSIMHRSKYKAFNEATNMFDPKAFISVEDVKYSKDGIFHPDQHKLRLENLFPIRKSK